MATWCNPPEILHGALSREQILEAVKPPETAEPNEALARVRAYLMTAILPPPELPKLEEPKPEEPARPGSSRFEFL